MKTTDLISSHLTEAFEGNNWSDVNVRDTIADITFDEAVAITRASPNTIAALIYHMTFYNKAIRDRLDGREPNISNENGFDMPPVTSQREWESLRSSAMQAAYELARSIRSFPEKQLMEENPPGKGTYYKKLQGVIEHNYYHLGQIVILKKLIRSKK